MSERGIVEVKGREKMDKIDYLKVPSRYDAQGKGPAKNESKGHSKQDMIGQGKGQIKQDSKAKEISSKVTMKQETLGRVNSKQDILGKRPDVKILFLGAKNVGKTALIVRFVTKRYIGEYDQTQDASYTKQITINAQEVTIEMMDIQAPDSKKNMRGKIEMADAVVLVYSVTNKRSFDEAKNLKEAIDLTSPYRRKPIVLIANKTDLRNTRRITSSEGQALAKRWGCSYLECSAAIYTSGYEVICEAIVELCQEVIRMNEMLRTAGKIGRRRASLSPRPFRDAIFKMFGTTKDDILACKQSDL